MSTYQEHMDRKQQELNEAVDRLSDAYLDQMDKLIEKGVYGSKSEIVREALRLLFEKYGVKIWE